MKLQRSRCCKQNYDAPDMATRGHANAAFHQYQCERAHSLGKRRGPQTCSHSIPKQLHSRHTNLVATCLSYFLLLLSLSPVTFLCTAKMLPFNQPTNFGRKGILATESIKPIFGGSKREENSPRLHVVCVCTFEDLLSYEFIFGGHLQKD